VAPLLLQVLLGKDVPDYAIVAGVPAKVIRYRFTPDEIYQLNVLAWWNWRGKVTSNANKICAA
jgi:serine acetyltransferase